MIWPTSINYTEVECAACRRRETIPELDFDDLVANNLLDTWICTLCRFGIGHAEVIQCECGADKSNTKYHAYWCNKPENKWKPSK